MDTKNRKKVLEEMAVHGFQTPKKFFEAYRQAAIEKIYSINMSSPIEHPMPSVFGWSYVSDGDGDFFTNGTEKVWATWKDLANLLARLHCHDIVTGLGFGLDWAKNKIQQSLVEKASDNNGLNAMAERYNQAVISEIK